MMLFMALATGCTAPDSGGDSPIPGDSGTEDSSIDSSPPDSGDDTAGLVDGDGDGFAEADDCDDGRAWVYPGAPEIPGNGVDEDCDGTDLPDDDGDGHVPTAAGGDDCDDTDPYAYAGALDACDPVDQDCDGEPLAAGACGEVQDPAVIARELIERTGLSGSLIGDHTGDGVSDLLLSLDDVAPPEGGTARGYALYAGPITGLPWPSLEGAVQTWANPGYAALLRDAGDTDGDGVRDLLVADIFSYQILVLRSPFEGGADVSWIGDTDTAWTSSPVSYEGYAHKLAAGRDFDGDGRADAAALMETHDAVEPVSFHAFFGGHFDGTYVSVRGSGGASDIQTIGDVDGDGLADLSILESTAAFIVSGAQLRSADGAAVDELALLSVERYADSHGRLGHPMRAETDLDGDGLPEFLVSDSTADWLGYEHGAVYVFDGASRGTLTLVEARGSWVGDGTGTKVGSGYLSFADLDADGVEDVVVGARRADMVTGMVLLPGRMPTPAEDALGSGIFLNYASGGLGDGEDVNGDGYDDFLFYDGLAETGRILYGWDVPWSQGEYW
jgi:hypothetical protein